MKNDRSGSFSDLEAARSLTRRLSEPTPVDTSSPTTEPPPYVRFRPAATLSPDASATTDAYGNSGWHRFLDECLRHASADTAFVMDRDGLLVAVRGSATASALEPIAAYLSSMFSQATRMQRDGDPPRALAIEIEPGWLTAISLGIQEPITLGVVSSQPVHSALMARVRHVIPA